MCPDPSLRIGMSDGGLVTEAKPHIQWDKVANLEEYIKMNCILLNTELFLLLLLLLFITFVLNPGFCA